MSARIARVEFGSGHYKFFRVTLIDAPWSSLPGTQPLQFGVQPWAACHRRPAAALHQVCPAAHAALTGRALDELLRAGDRALTQQVIQLAAQMRLRLHRRMPAAVAPELSARRRQTRQQAFDLVPGSRRQGRRVKRRRAEQQGQQRTLYDATAECHAARPDRSIDVSHSLPALAIETVSSLAPCANAGSFCGPCDPG